MKRWLFVLLAMGLLTVLLVGCGQQATVTETIEGGYKTYYKMSDDTWKCGDQMYQYRLEITGRMPNAAVDSTFVYLSNLPDITFEQAWKAAGLSSDTADYFDPKDAVLVEMN